MKNLTAKLFALISHNIKIKKNVYSIKKLIIVEEFSGFYTFRFLKGGSLYKMAIREKGEVRFLIYFFI